MVRLTSFLYKKKIQFGLFSNQKARTMEMEMEQNKKINKITDATNALNHKLLLNDDDIEKFLPEHPFYHSLKSQFK